MYGVCFGALTARLGPWSAALMSNISRLFGLDRCVANGQTPAGSGCRVLDPRLEMAGQSSNRPHQYQSRSIGQPGFHPRGERHAPLHPLLMGCQK